MRREGDRSKVPSFGARASLPYCRTSFSYNTTHRRPDYERPGEDSVGRSFLRISAMAASMVFILSQPSFSQVERDPNAVNHDRVFQHDAIGGKRSILASLYGLELNCTPTAWKAVTLSKAPENGEAKLEDGLVFFSSLRRSNADTTKCDGKSTSAKLLYYTPNKGYTGSDSIELEVVNDHGQRFTYTYNITVK
jgi:hypothetical protein